MSYRWSQVLLRGALCLATVSVLTFLAPIAQAGLVTFKFTGVMDTVDAALSPPIAQNTPFTGSYGFESTTRNWESEPGVGVYSVSHFSMEISGKHYSFDPNGGGFNGPAYHLINRSGTWSDDGNTYLLGPNGLYAIYINALVGDPINGLAPSEGGFSIQLLNGRSIFTEGSNLLTPPLLTAPSLGNFLENKVALGFNHPTAGSIFANGHLTSLTLAPVPLPGSLLLFGSSLVGLAGFGLRRRVARSRRATPESSPTPGH